MWDDNFPSVVESKYSLNKWMNKCNAQLYVCIDKESDICWGTCTDGQIFS